MRLDVLSIIGLILAVVAILGGSILKGSGIAALWSSAAFVIVIIGTLAAGMLQSRPRMFFAAFRMLVQIFWPPAIDHQASVNKILVWSQVSRRDGLLGLERIADEEEDTFSQKGLQLLVDGNDPEAIRNTLEIDLDLIEEEDMQAARVFEALGTYAPTLGIIGAVLGLISVLKNLADPEKLGSGIATAFVATIYGIASANLFFLPVANKLKSLIHRRSNLREMIIEGIVAIAKGENPRAIEARLSGYQ